MIPGGLLAGATVRPSVATSFFFVPALLRFIFTLLFSPSFSASLSYFIFAVFIHVCSGEHSSMSSTFPLAVLNGPSFFFARQSCSCFGQSFTYQKLNYNNNHPWWLTWPYLVTSHYIVFLLWAIISALWKVKFIFTPNVKGFILLQQFMFTLNMKGSFCYSNSCSLWTWRVHSVKAIHVRSEREGFHYVAEIHVHPEREGFHSVTEIHVHPEHEWFHSVTAKPRLARSS